jgi:hypothetical protein
MIALDNILPFPLPSFLPFQQFQCSSQVPGAHSFDDDDLLFRFVTVESRIKGVFFGGLRLERNDLKFSLPYCHQIKLYDLQSTGGLPYAKAILLQSTGLLSAMCNLQSVSTALSGDLITSYRYGSGVD